MKYRPQPPTGGLQIENPSEKSYSREGIEWVDFLRLAENTPTHPMDFRVRSDTCRSLMFENRFVPGPARGTTGHKETVFIQCRAMVLCVVDIKTDVDYSLIHRRLFFR